MRSLLIFANHASTFIPLTVESYLDEMNKYFTDIIVATDYKGYLDLPYNILRCPNEGYDFGKYYLTLKNIKINKYDRIAFVNDSNSLVGTFEKVFEWAKTCNLDMWGLTDSIEGAPTIIPTTELRFQINMTPKEASYHIQSPFLVFEKAAHKYLFPFFESIDFEKKLMKPASPALRDLIIENCEIGLSQFLLRQDMKIGARWTVKNMPLDHAKRINPHLHDWEKLIKNGYPLIKNKIVLGEWDHIIPKPKNRAKYYRYG